MRGWSFSEEAALAKTVWGRRARTILAAARRAGNIFAHFAFAAAGEEGEEIGVAVFLAQDGKTRGHGMPDKLGVESRLFVEFFFEGKDAEHAVEPAGQAGQTGAIPGPDLGTDVVKEFEARAVWLQGFGQAEVKAGVIDEEDGVGFSRAMRSRAWSNF